VLDAAEVSAHLPELVQESLQVGQLPWCGSSEDLEDQAEDGAAAIAQRQITQLDVVVGTAGGTTPFVHAHSLQRDSEERRPFFIACVPIEQVSAEADIDIRLF